MATGKKQFIIFHVVGILFFLCLPLLFLSNGPDNKSILAVAGNPWFWIFSFTYISIFYLNAYWLFPRFYLEKKYSIYVLSLLALLVIVYFIQPFDHIISASPPPRQPQINFDAHLYRTMPPPNSRSIDFVSIFLYIIVIGLSVIIPVVQQWQKTQQQYLMVQKDKAHAELSFLKAQINPHFLFNTLNNLYSLALSGSERTAESILRLSGIMRYVTDEVNNDLVLLANEIACIRDFIELQKLRLNSKTTVLFNNDTADRNLSIAPLILLPFVENVFKHGISNNEYSTIEIKVATRQKEILFYAKNTIFNSERNEARKGTGIDNVKKRLENLYPGRHFLKTEISGNNFEVHLIINT